MRTDWISTLREDLNKQDADWRAEVIAGELVEHGIPEDTIIFCSEGTSMRAVSKDIIDVQYEPDTQEDRLLIHISREGLYDSLPEGLFHQSYNSKPHKTKQDIIDQIKVQREEEKQARKFFLPVENEFYHSRLTLELKEKNATNEFSLSNRLLFNYLYGDSSYLNRQQINLLLQLLPLAHKIRGNYNLIAQCVERTMNVSVHLEEKLVNKAHTGALHPGQLANCHLGVDSILGNVFDESHTHLLLTVGPVEANEVKTYLPGGKNEKVLQRLLDFFIPAGIEVNTSIVIKKNQHDFFLMDEQKVSYLAYNTYI